MGQTLLSFVAASEALDSLENQRVDKLPGRQALLRIAKLLKRVERMLRLRKIFTVTLQ